MLENIQDLILDNYSDDRIKKLSNLLKVWQKYPHALILQTDTLKFFEEISRSIILSEEIQDVVDKYSVREKRKNELKAEIAKFKKELDDLGG